jgi:DNA-directed RNA polymerase specialized sigma24 family protein
MKFPLVRRGDNAPAHPEPPVPTVRIDNAPAQPEQAIETVRIDGAPARVAQAPRVRGESELKEAPAGKLAIPSGPPGAETVTDELVCKARSLRKWAVLKLVAAHHPRISRIAIGICGHEKLGRATVRKVLKQSLRFMPGWETALAAEKWFFHYTILVAREKAGERVNPKHDCLVRRVDRPTTQYVAFVRAIRSLDPRQAEALMLALGERLELRQAAMAMDSSTTAVSTHMEQANKLLTPIAGREFDPLFSTLARVYASLTPPRQTIEADLAMVRRRLTWRQIRRTVMFLLTLALLGAIALGFGS